MQEYFKAQISSYNVLFGMVVSALAYMCILSYKCFVHVIEPVIAVTLPSTITTSAFIGLYLCVPVTDCFL